MRQYKGSTPLSFVSWMGIEFGYLDLVLILSWSGGRNPDAPNNEPASYTPYLLLMLAMSCFWDGAWVVVDASVLRETFFQNKCHGTLEQIARVALMMQWCFSSDRSWLTVVTLLHRHRDEWGKILFCADHKRKELMLAYFIFVTTITTAGCVKIFSQV